MKLKSFSEGHNENVKKNPGSGCPSPPYPTRSPTGSHSNWPIPPLDPIIERSSSVHSLRSPAKLRPGPGNPVEVIEASEAVASVKPSLLQSWSWRVPSHELTQKLEAYKSLSAPNVDHVASSFPRHCSSTSSLNSQVLQDIPLNPAAPARPILPPPERRPTPDSIPSFGTKDAQALRLQPDTAFRRTTRALFSWLRGTPESSEGPLPDGTPNMSPVAPGSPEQRSSGVPLDMMQRIFGVSRADNPQQASLRPTLPRGITIADSSGPLAVAEDGTFVRGKFGGRMSAHSIGSRGLSSHPLTALSGPKPMSSSIRPESEALSTLRSHRSSRRQASVTAGPAFISPDPSFNQPTSLRSPPGALQMQEPRLYARCTTDSNGDIRPYHDVQAGAHPPPYESGSRTPARLARTERSQESEGRCCACCSSSPKAIPPTSQEQLQEQIQRDYARQQKKEERRRRKEKRRRQGSEARSSCGGGLMATIGGGTAASCAAAGAGGALCSAGGGC